MNRILADVRAFGVQFVRSRVGAFFALAFPVILILLFGSIFSQGGTSSVPLYIQDLDNTNVSHAFVDSLNRTTVLDYRGVPSNVDIRDYIRQNSVNLALRIPKGFGAEVGRCRANASLCVPANITIFGDPTQSSYGIGLAAIASVANSFGRGQPAVVPSLESVAVRHLRFIDLFLPGVIGLTVLTNPLFGMTNVCAEYRTRKFFKFLATTKLTKGEWLVSKVVWYSFLMLVSTAIMFALERVVLGGEAVITPTAILLILAGTFEFTSLGMILGLYVRDIETAAAVANAIGFPMMFLAGSFFPIDTMPPTLQTVARLLPLTYVNEGLRATMVFGNEATALLYLGITVVVGVLLFIVPAKALSWKSK